jgi:bifunctional non-homologous end joining protein LigD
LPKRTRLTIPGFIKPQLATLKSKAPKGDHWLHEIKVYSRNGLDWTKRFTTIASALDIPGEAIIDGEVVVVYEGRTNYSELQAELAAGRQDRLVYYAFDLLWRNGDLRKLSQLERKQALLAMLGENDMLRVQAKLLPHGQLRDHVMRRIRQHRVERS